MDIKTISVQCGLNSTLSSRGCVSSRCLTAGSIEEPLDPAVKQRYDTQPRDDKTSNYDRAQYKNLFWPVCTAMPVPISISFDIFSKPYSLIFSSKTAIDFFYTNVFQKNENILNNCESVYFVGEKSKLYFNKLFRMCFKNNMLFSSNKVGMQNLIDEFNLTDEKRHLIFFTALSGKSKTIIEGTNFKSSHSLVPIYQLVPYESDFLKQLFEQFQELREQKIIFVCHSGQILEQAARFLMEYFSCNDILTLPKNIYFSCFGQSTFDKVKQLYANTTNQGTY